MKLRYAGVALAVALPALLVVSALRTYQAVGGMREVFLRHRAAMIAYQLELAPGGHNEIEELRAHEPDLLDVEVFAGPLQPGGDAGAVNALFRGETLYFASETTAGGRRIYRVYLPVHRRDSPAAEPKLVVARLDLAAAGADFLVRDGQRNLLLAALAAAGSLLVLGAYLLATRRRLEREHLAELGELSAVLAHEIRNPLGTIKGYMQLAGERSDRGVESLLEPALAEAERLEKLVRDLLLFARPQQVTPGTVRWAELAARLPAVAEEAGRGRPIRLSVDPAPGLEITSDPDALFQILANLVRNSAEALVKGGEIRVVARSDRRAAVIQVEDNGPGLDRSARERAFLPFFTTKTFGTGLGLAISRRLARQLGGKLELESVEPHGTRAVLTLVSGSQSSAASRRQAA